MWPLPVAQRIIIVAGCLGMAYTQLTTSAASIEFVRALGGTGLHIGIFGALPTGMLFLQFLAAIVSNRLQYRRQMWFWLTLVQRLIVLPFAAGPWLLPDVSDAVWVWMFLAVTAVNQGLIHFTTPLWLSWMGDYLPRTGLSQYWGVRHLWMQWTAAASMLFSGWMLLGTDVPMRLAFPILVGVGCVLGVIDICLFFRVEEPPVTRYPEPGLWELLSGPFRNHEMRSFIRFTSFWHFSAMIGAPFISLYLLEAIGLSIGQVLLIWTFSWVGGAFCSGWIGRLAEEHGNRAVLSTCTWMKSINMLGLLLTPHDNTIAMMILIPVLMFDAILNAGFAIATNGFLLKNSPAANRTMYIAAGTAVAGLVGGVTSVVAGGVLSLLQDGTFGTFSDPRTSYHILFAASFIMRLASGFVVVGIQEPNTAERLPTLTTLIGMNPSRVLRFPVGLYQSWHVSDVRKIRKKRRPAAAPTTAVILHGEEASVPKPHRPEPVLSAK